MRLLLNEFHDDQWKWRNEPQVLRYTRQSFPTSFQSHVGWLKSIRNNPRCLYFGIQVESGEIVGYCGLSQIMNDPVRDHGTAEYSMLIAPLHQGKKYGSQALSILLDYGFQDKNLELIWGEILESNVAGRKLAQRLGFMEEALLRSRYQKEGKRENSIMVSITNTEWNVKSVENSILKWKHSQ